MRMLERNATVDTIYGGGFVAEHRRPDRAAVVSPTTGSTTSTACRRGRARPKPSCTSGDHVWWDRHDWSAAREHPGRCRLLPGALRRRLRRPRYPAAESSARRPRRSPAGGRGTCSGAQDRRLARLPAVLAVQPLAARVVGPYSTLTADRTADQLPAARRRERRLRALRGSRHKLELLGQSGRVVRTPAPAPACRGDALHGPAARLVRHRHRRGRRHGGGAGVQRRHARWALRGRVSQTTPRSAARQEP
jgi:hypothetical protein